ncbi:MAG: delta-60 repeat domain-containing protein, partial [Actinomycetota bacterium]|nr:delta-60 repeat domain-containing protein [Actinomycetota bacterium]
MPSLAVTVVAMAAGAALTPLTPVHASEVPLPKVVSANPVDWTPDVEDGRVRQTATVGDVTIAVGNFTQVTERGTGTTFDRQDIVAFDTTGAVSTTFVPQFDGPEIYDVIPSGDGSTVYVAGAFANVDGLARTGRVVRLNVTTGAVDPTFRSPGLDNRATELALVDGRLLVGGSFTTVGGQPRTQLVELDPTTGDDTGHVDLTFAGTQNGGVTTVTKMAASADGDRLVVVGNFLTVDGQSRPQIAVVDISATNAQLHSWATQRYGTQCSPHFKSYVNDVDVSPDSSFFVVVTTGAYSGGPNAGTLCDTV